MKIRQAQNSDLNEWVELRSRLWPDDTMENLYKECLDILASDHDVCFLAYKDTGQAVAFIEGSLRGTIKKPYGHIEGWYVRNKYRGKGHGASLMNTLEQWFLHHAIGILHSDTDDNYPLSPKAHSAVGFKEVANIRIFIKEI